MLVKKESWDKEMKNDNDTPQSFGYAKEEVKQYGGMTKKETAVLKEKKELQPHAKSEEEGQHTIARTNAWKEKDKGKK